MSERQEAEDRERVVVEFLYRLTSDLEQGTLLSLAEYLALFPGHDEAVAREFLDLVRQSTRFGSELESGGIRLGREGDTLEGEEDGGRSLGPYRLLEELGRGGQGSVYLAEDVRLDRRVALKVLETGVLGSETQLMRFRREAEVASRLEHPGLCTVHDVGEEGGHHYIAMRYLEGGSLAQRIATSSMPEDAASIEAALVTVEKVARALHKAHEARVVHRDVKPSNIMLDGEGEPVVVDFGFARDELTSQETLTRSGSVFGTPAYMSPEQLSGYTKPLDRRTDVYALGVTLYELLTHRLPYEAPTVQALGVLVRMAPVPDARKRNPSLGRELCVVLQTAMEKELERRYASAEAFADDLRNLLEHRPIQARPASLGLRARRWVKRNPAPTGALLVGLVALLLTAWFLLRERGFRQNLEQLGDHRLVHNLLASERDELWPVRHELYAEGSLWLAQARNLLARRAQHEAFRERLRAQGDPARVELVQLLDELLSEAERLEQRVPSVEARVERARDYRARWSEGEAARRWIACRESIAALPVYGGLDLQPQRGLVPLWRSASSGLWEFFVLDSGEWPDADQEFAELENPNGAAAGVVLVLLPGGRFRMGAPDSLAQYSSWAPATPAHEVELAPFFLSKYELSQGQWARGAEGANPSWYSPAEPRLEEYAADEPLELDHPVENVSWNEALAWLGRQDLELPTEAQWEYACRAGSTTMTAFGDDPEGSLTGYANIAGAERAGLPGFERTDSWNDGWLRHAPAGSYPPNAFGLHDMHGNVQEWCRDGVVKSYADVQRRPADGLDLGGADSAERIFRGGSFYRTSMFAASPLRRWSTPEQRFPDVGLRAARRVD